MSCESFSAPDSLFTCQRTRFQLPFPVAWEGHPSRSPFRFHSTRAHLSTSACQPRQDVFFNFSSFFRRPRFREDLQSNPPCRRPRPTYTLNFQCRFGLSPEPAALAEACSSRPSRCHPAPSRLGRCRSRQREGSVSTEPRRVRQHLFSLSSIFFRGRLAAPGHSVSQTRFAEAPPAAPSRRRWKCSLSVFRELLSFRPRLSRRAERLLTSSLRGRQPFFSSAFVFSVGRSGREVEGVGLVPRREKRLSTKPAPESSNFFTFFHSLFQDIAAAISGDDA